MRQLCLSVLILSSLILYSCKKNEEDLKPLIIGISPQKAPTGEYITIVGRNFTVNPDEVTVKFNGVKADYLRSATMDSIVVQVPYNATTGKVQVIIRGMAATSPADFIVADVTNIQAYFPDPVITALAPVTAGIGDQVVITGSNFMGSQMQEDGTQVGYSLYRVNVNGVGAPILEHSDTRIVITIPSGATTGKVTVTTGADVYRIKKVERTTTSTNDLVIAAGGTWTTKASLFPGLQRWDAFGFSIGNKGYYGLGHGINITGKDFWEYDPTTNQWTRKADFPGTVQSAGFSIGNQGYVAGSTDFWQYDPALNQWTRKADFPGPSRSQAVGFSISNKGYLATGYSDATSSALSDLWEYDPTSNQWTKKADLPGAGRSKAVGFSIQDKGYVGTGGSGPATSSSTTFNDFWEYNPATNQWTRKADLPGGNREGAVAWAIGNHGYVGAGFTFVAGGPSTSHPDYWQFSPVTNEWKRTADGEAASSVGTFTIGNSGYYVEFNNENSSPQVQQFTVQ